ncbi:MAG TPA: ketoacyl-ACP synthase III [Paludibacter sp.]|nr:ketoacyl-ACP synthase III [Paludibacter sp.]
MNVLSFKGIDIVAVAACVPRNVVDNAAFAKNLYPDEIQLQKIIETIGVTERRVSPPSVCTSDLCFAAADKLLEETGTDRSEIDALIFVSQTPDYRLPATAVVLQYRLGLSKQVVAFDVNLGCSGYVYGLSVAFSFANNQSVRKVLLLVGDTPTKFVSAGDLSASLLFGDCGTATLIEKTNSDKSTYFNLFSDGSGYKSLIINGGGYRNPSSPSSFESITDENGNSRNSEQLYMNGGEIFNFTLREIVKSANQLIASCGTEMGCVDQFVFHQANKFMIDFLCKKMKINPEKFLVSIENYGNTSAASIPLTLVVNRNENAYNQVLMSGFGVGLSWGNCFVKLNRTHILNLIEL